MLQAQLAAFDVQLAVLEGILRPLAEWGKTWARFERLAMNAGRDPGLRLARTRVRLWILRLARRWPGACDLARLPVPGLSTFPQPRPSTVVHGLTSVFTQITHRSVHRTLPWQGQGWRDRSKLSC